MIQHDSKCSRLIPNHSRCFQMTTRDSTSMPLGLYVRFQFESILASLPNPLRFHPELTLQSSSLSTRVLQRMHVVFTSPFLSNSFWNHFDFRHSGSLWQCIVSTRPFVWVSERISTICARVILVLAHFYDVGGRVRMGLTTSLDYAILSSRHQA